MGLSLSSSLLDIRGVGARFFPKLKKLGIYTVGDLLFHFPTRYEDYSRIYHIDDLEPGQFATVQGVVEDIDVRQSWRRNFSITEATIADETGSIKARWFNQPYIQTQLRGGKMLNFSGKIFLSQDHELYLSNPSFEVPGLRTKHTARLVPIYPETKGLTSKGIRFLIHPILKTLSLKEWIPPETIEHFEIPDLNKALYTIHFPTTIEEAMAAKKRFVFENLFLLQLVTIERKLSIAKEKATPIETDIEWLKDVLTHLPFELTQSQKKCLWDIIKDMAQPHPMNRLLQGDVGSGKTVVAAIAALIAARHGIQTAFMAPTEVLARQHFETLKKLFRGVGSSIQPPTALIVGGGAKVFYENDLESETSKESVKKAIAKGNVTIVIGTHALIQKDVAFANLGLVIVDEQHRFGVRQRAALGARATAPHFLSMSATPIPRTLMLTVFGDLDISIVRELPSGRKSITTKIVPPHERDATYQLIKKEITAGRQAFVICPRIEPSQEDEKRITKNWRFSPATKTTEFKSVKAEYEKLSKKIFPELNVGMLHGQMSVEEKIKNMKAFSTGKIDILVATSVVEVGVDIPNASIMMIEGSERFGLAQLYQLRGRVGRAEHQSYCYLFTESEAVETLRRLQALLKATNGFELAEYDLKLRGPGQFFGEEQKGLPDIAMEGLQNPELVEETREAAREILFHDASLARHSSLLRERVKLFKARLHVE